MLVLIYNGASKPTPANFIADLEDFDIISKVVISPNIIPDAKTKNAISSLYLKAVGWPYGTTLEIIAICLGYNGRNENISVYRY